MPFGWSDLANLAGTVINYAPDALKLLDAIIALCRSTGATDEEIRARLPGQATDELERINEELAHDEEVERSLFPEGGKVNP